MNMRFNGWLGTVAVFCALGLPAASRAANCTTQAEMQPAERDALAAASQRLAMAVVQQDFSTLQASLLPMVAGQWQGIREAVEQGAPEVKAGQVQLRNLYLLDASGLTAPADTQFFCTGAGGNLTVTMSMTSLPPGKYAVALADVTGNPLSGQIGFILGSDANAWKLGGVFIRPGTLDGHDDVWYWQRARDLAKANEAWSAYYAYDVAHYLALPVSFISSPNLERLEQEQGQLKNGPNNAFPFTVTAGDRSWKIESIRFDPALREPDLGVTYDSAGVSDPAAQRTEAIAVLGALLKAKPGIRRSFHGLWAYASNDGKVTPVMELPMDQIP